MPLFLISMSDAEIFSMQVSINRPTKITLNNASKFKEKKLKKQTLFPFILD
jgi:hypothetical protein